MRVLVTGGAGFIGSHLVDALVARGDDVAVVDDMSGGRPGRVADEPVVHKLSVTEGAAVAAVTADFRPELICHLAARVDVRTSVSDPADDALVNVVGTINVLEAARQVGARVILGSTGAVIYGRDAPIPSLEDVLPLPESPYGIAKYCAEQYIGLYNRLHGAAHSVLRLANVYGPRQDPAGEAGVITIFCASALAGHQPTIYGDGTQTRDYVYVGDAVQAFLTAGDNDRPGTWNIGAGVEISVLDLVTIISGVAGRDLRPEFAPARAGELQRSAVAADRAASELGWHPATPLADGIRRVYEWIEQGAHDRAPC